MILDDDADSIISEGEEVIVENTESKREEQERLSKLSKCATSGKRCLSYNFDIDKQKEIILELCPVCGYESICETCLSAGVVKCRTCVGDEEIKKFADQRRNDMSMKEAQQRKKLLMAKVIVTCYFNSLYYNQLNRRLDSHPRWLITTTLATSFMTMTKFSPHRTKKK